MITGFLIVGAMCLMCYFKGRDDTIIKKTAAHNAEVISATVDSLIDNGYLRTVERNNKIFVIPLDANEEDFDYGSIAENDDT